MSSDWYKPRLVQTVARYDIRYMVYGPTKILFLTDGRIIKCQSHVMGNHDIIPIQEPEKVYFQYVKNIVQIPVKDFLSDERFA